jgi:hypothetical protein
VLVEDPDGATRSSAARVLERAGFEVAACPGPDADAGRYCPEVRDGSCPLVAGADVVYTNLPWQLPDSREVLRAHRRCSPRTPVVVEICEPQVSQVGDLLDGCQVVHVPSGSATMLGAVRRVGRSS